MSSKSAKVKFPNASQLFPMRKFQQKLLHSTTRSLQHLKKTRNFLAWLLDHPHLISHGRSRALNSNQTNEYDNCLKDRSTFVKLLDKMLGKLIKKVIQKHVSIDVFQTANTLALLKTPLPKIQSLTS